MGGFSSTTFSTYVFPSEMIFVFILPSGTTADCCFFKVLTSASSCALRFCNASTACSSFCSRSASEGVPIEQFGNRVSNVEHQHSQAAVHLVRAGAASVGCLANAPNRRQRSVNQPNNGAKLYPAHGPRK